MPLSVELVNPEGEIWSGPADLVIARTLDGEIGILSGHAPVIGILAEGSTVTIRASDLAGADVYAAVSGGFLSVADDRVSILAKQALLGQNVNVEATQAALDQALARFEGTGGGPEEPADVRYYRALLQAAEDAG